MMIAMLMLSACAAFPEKTEQEKTADWWDSFYGRSSSAEKASEPDCDFYGNCKSAKKSGNWW